MSSQSRDSFLRRLEDLFLAGAELSQQERQDFLNVNCPDESDLADQLLRMWAIDDKTALQNSPPRYLWAPGKLVCNDRYEIRTALARGGMGEVYEAVDYTLNRPVALKIFRPEDYSIWSDDASSRVKYEAKVISSLRHPNICYIFNLEFEGDIPVLVLELLDGETLNQRLSRGALYPQEVIQITYQILNALAFLHEKGIIHQDLKPSNIMLTGSGVKILDFGIASWAKADIMPLRAGTRGYMSPEQLAGSSVDSRSDLFSLGIIVEEMLSSHRMASTFRLIAPNFLRTFARRCQNAEPDRRFQTAPEAKAFLASRIRLRNTARILALTAAAVAAALWVRSLVKPTIPSPRELLPHRFAEDEHPTSVALSPDASSVVYSSSRLGESDLWMRKPPGGQPIRLTKGQAAVDPFFHPDGKEIAYHSNRGQGAVYVLSLANGTQHLIAPGGQKPSYSPNGEWMSWITGDFHAGNGSSELWLMPSHGGQIHRIGEDLSAIAQPVFSPNSQQIAFNGCSPSGSLCDVYVESIVGGRATRVSLAPRLSSVGMKRGSLWGWTPAGMFFGPDEQEAGFLTFVHADQNLRFGSPQHLISSRLPSEGISIANGSIAFCSKHIEYEVQNVSLDTDHPHLTNDQNLSSVPGASGYIMGPRLSIDGHYLAYASWSKSFQEPENTLKILDTKSGSVVSLGGPGQKGGPFFLADNHTLVYTVGVTTAPQTFVADATGTPGKLILRYRTDHVSPDGNIVVSCAGNLVIAVNLKTGQHSVILNGGPDRLFTPRISNDQRAIAFTVQSSTSSPQIFITHFEDLHPSDRSEWIPIAPNSALNDKPEWSPNSAALYFVSDRDGHRCIWAQKLTSHTKSPVGAPVAIRHFHEFEDRTGLRDMELGFQSLSAAHDRLSMLVRESSHTAWIAELPPDLYAR